jgi:uncharacterized membrane protein affecting hemolysin expression
MRLPRVTPFRDWSVARQIRVAIMATTTVALLCICVTAFVYNRTGIRRRVVADMSAAADILGANSVAALSFHDERAAAEMLRALEAKPHVMAAAVYDGQGALFAQYRR